MIKDYRPYYLKKTWYGVFKLYVRFKLAPQMASFGKNHFIVKPWHIVFFGEPIHIGDHISILGCSDNKIRITVWPQGKPVKGIVIGDHVLISPGVRISASNHIHISDSCMLASNVYISDSDWHGIYNRAISTAGEISVVLEENVWVGDSAIICKGVRIGKNSIIGAGAVVTSDIPPNVIAAGNPARVVKTLDPDKPITTRKDWFLEFEKKDKMYDFFEKEQLKGNTLFGWLRSIFFPKRETQFNK